MDSTREDRGDSDSIHHFLAQYLAGHPPGPDVSGPFITDATLSSTEPFAGPTTHTATAAAVSEDPPDRRELTDQALRLLHEHAAAPDPRLLASHRIPCEFKWYAGCSATFDALTQTDAWILHELEAHLGWEPPPTCLCWFCDDYKFVTKLSSHGDVKENFRSRMIHIAGHFQEGLVDAWAIRPDFFFLDYLWEKRMIPLDVFERVKGVHEALRVEGLTPRRYRTGKFLMEGESETIIIDTASEERKRRMEERDRRRGEGKTGEGRSKLREKRERVQKEKDKKEREEKERVQKERLEKERVEKERVEKERNERNEEGERTEESITDVESLWDAMSSIGTWTTEPSDIHSPLQEVVRLFLSQEDLEKLFKVATSLVTKDRLELNISRLLRRYGTNLTAEASDDRKGEREVAVFVVRNAKRVARTISAIICGEEDRERLWREKGKEPAQGFDINAWLTSAQPTAPGEDVSGPESEPECAGDEVSVDGMKEFMISSQAYRTFHEDIRSWLKLPRLPDAPSTREQVNEVSGCNSVGSQLKTDNVEHIPTGTCLGLSPDGADDLVPMSSTLESGNGEDRLPQMATDDNTYDGIIATAQSQEDDQEPGSDYRLRSSSPHFERPETRLSETIPGSVLGPTSIHQQLGQAAYWKIRRWVRWGIGAVYEAIQGRPWDGRLYVGWNCRCGKRLRIEVPECYRHGATRFAQDAAGLSQSRSVSITSSDSSSTAQSQSQRPESTETPESTDPSTPDSTTHSPGSAPQYPVHATGTKRYLLVCVNSSPTRTTMRNINLTNVGHDEVLFHKIRQAYREMRGIYFRNPFIVPQTIQYVKFELINRQRTGQCVGNFEPDSIPPVKEVYNGRYAYIPCPPDIGKYPMHPHVFMHSLLEPGDHTGSVAVERLPKKMHVILEHKGNLLDLPVGWGIYIVEGLNWGLIRIVVASATVVTLGLTLGWCVGMRDVQGGAGIGSYAATIVAISLSVSVIGRKTTT